MSRIFEALQRAELERRDIFNPQPEDTPEDIGVQAGAEPLPTKAFIDLDAISQHPWKPSMASLPTLAERGECVEQFRSLRSQIYMLSLEKKMKTILVSSGMMGEGKSFVAVNLAMSLVRNNDRRVLLIDGDLRRPSVHRLLGAPISPGLADYFAGNAKPTAIMQRDRTPRANEGQPVRALSNVTFIPAGDPSDNSPDISGKQGIEELIASLTSYFDWIIIDSPPVLAVTDAVDLARAADAVLLVAREATTPYDVAQRAQAAFSSSRILGFVLNAAKNPPRSGYYYSYSADQETDRTRKRRKN